MKRSFKIAAPTLLAVAVLVFVTIRVFDSHSSVKGPSGPSYIDLIGSRAEGGLIASGRIEEVTINTGDNTIDVKKTDGSTFSTGYPPDAEAGLVKLLKGARVKKTTIKGKDSSPLIPKLLIYLPLILIIGAVLLVIDQIRRLMGPRDSKRKPVETPKVTFRDVAGVDEAVRELQEVKEFLENPHKFQAFGAHIPKGILLYGPPGTGKTLLARAVAGEAGVPFFSLSGSDFVEVFVGLGAKRVRALFEQAKQNSPCIIFMDEIDAVGGHRGGGLGGGHDGREHTLNQLLVEMDGFDADDNIILVAATNRPDMLDPALLRPGRFDRQIIVDRPDRKGRRKILEVHARDKPLAKSIDFDVLAGQTSGFTGADLANLMNESALLTVRQSRREISMKELEESVMRVVAGPENKTRVMSDKDKLVTAYHELGHAIVGHELPGCAPVHKISIISRGQALGHTIALPTEDKFLTFRAELLDVLAMTLGGRAAEEMVFGDVSTGASNDLEKVTETAKQMVMRFGMSEQLGQRVFGADEAQPLLGRQLSVEPDYSDVIAQKIDDEILHIIKAAYETAKTLLTERRGELDRISKILRERETIDARQFVALLEGREESEIFDGEENDIDIVSSETEPTKHEHSQSRRSGYAGA